MIDGSSKNRVVDHTLTELWKDPYMEDVRESFKKGERHPACIKCWNEEDAGRDSKRIRDNAKFDFAETDGIKTLELNMGNTCNIKCRTCHPYSSSLWLNEYYDTMIEGVKLPKKEYLINAKIYNDSWEKESKLWSEIEDIGKDVIQIDFYGGEPWLIKQQWEFIEKSVANGWSKNQTLHYNTNGTQWNEEHIKLFDHFKFVDIGFSIDGIGPQFEFMRHPAKWDEVYANMQKAREWAKGRDNILFGICHTISALNVYYVPEFLEFFEKENWHIYLNLVHLSLIHI
jgi:MoaA/NifB/PqqE/SkfB family radical SAM enzyme